jgi:photosynthetic reaction center H subunit
MSGGHFLQIDVAQVMIWLFWFFFLGLIMYLRREDRREGYPLESDETGRLYDDGSSFIFYPSPKTFKLPHGHGTKTVPHKSTRDRRTFALKRSAKWSGAPSFPTGNPMVDGVGPASYAERADVPDVTLHGDPKIVPLRVASDFAVVAQDKSPVGYAVIGADKREAGKVSDVWVDKAESLIRYIEVQLPDAANGPGLRVLVPMTMSVIKPKTRKVIVSAVTAAQFADAPGLKSDSQITFLEEEKVCGYFGGGYLYATPSRQEPII